MRIPMILLTSACLVGAAVAGEPGGLASDVGKPGPALMSSGWDGAPVSLAAAKGKAVVLAFWDSKASC